MTELYPGQAFFHEHNANIKRAEQVFEFFRARFYPTGAHMIAITKETLENWFTYHSPTPEQLPKYQAIREAGLTLAQTIVDNTPPSADQTASIRKIREAVMTANASIACGGQ
jgi:hypothetical protein